MLNSGHWLSLLPTDWSDAKESLPKKPAKHVTGVLGDVEGTFALYRIVTEGNRGKPMFANKERNVMTHECDDDPEDMDPIHELQHMPEHIRDEIIGNLMDVMSYVMDKAEQGGFLFDMITAWDRRKVAMFEATMAMEKQLLSDDE